jgi:hypothetical protein
VDEREVRGNGGVLKERIERRVEEGNGGEEEERRYKRCDGAVDGGVGI